MCALHLVWLRRKNHIALGKMGTHSKTKGPRRVGAQKHYPVLQSTGRQNRLEAHKHQKSLVYNYLPKIYSPKVLRRLDQISSKILHKIHLLEIPHFLLPRYWRRCCLESRTWEPSPSRSGPLARQWDYTHPLSINHQYPP
jgi:hypothetical protein